MGRKSSISRLRPEVRQRIERHLREDRLTLAEILADLHAQFPQEAQAGRLPSRTAIWRQKAKFEDLMAKAREHEQMASVLVAELGEKPDEKAGALLVQSITTLATHAALAAQGEDPDIETVRKLARAARDVIQTRQVDRKDRQAIREEARRELLEEQKAAFKTLEAKPGVSAEAMAEIRRVLGIE
ncbi:DUF3486 family protein [Allofranklinella schreckenbergeri]|uniref:DUF3486 family protein n=1 Tax=Allofranklinella schreckenbergeri TaxID=1076744 RepID=A0A3M6QWN3_9BURK|nr:phage protein Gp27 family protein [Allofranklinella schreckenbergeri]RMX07430.1 DUF3486 family protein [Allofranklinella schreckenbergeri]